MEKDYKEALEEFSVLTTDYHVSIDQSYMDENQVRLYRYIDDATRQYIIVTVTEE